MSDKVKKFVNKWLYLEYLESEMKADLVKLLTDTYNSAIDECIVVCKGLLKGRYDTQGIFDCIKQLQQLKEKTK